MKTNHINTGSTAFAASAKQTETTNTDAIPESGKCCLCGGQYRLLGCNPWPVNKERNARCCHECDGAIVFPARLLGRASTPKDKAATQKFMQNININTTGRTAQAVSAKQTTTSTRAHRPSFKWFRACGMKAKVSPEEYERRMAAYASIRPNLEKHEAFLQAFVALLDEDFGEFLSCVSHFRCEYGPKLQENGLKSFSDDDLALLLGSIQVFQEYSQYWSKALKPFAKMSGLLQISS